MKKILPILVVLIIIIVVSSLFFLLSRKSNILTNSNSEIPFKPYVPVSVQKTDDTDWDGLKDAEEVTLGTKVDSADTDSDGLLDGKEVNEYKTNPLKADTDGDGYTDFREIIGGFNPLGPGKLK